MLTALAAALLFASPLLAAPQLLYPTCATSWSWSLNSLGQSPCAVAAHLQGVCSDGAFFIPSLTPGNSYVGPTGPSDAFDLCKCNTIVYSLMSACGACQPVDAIWFPWKTWSTKCSTVDPPSKFSNIIPNVTRVPAWAFIDVTKEGTWNPVLSYQVGGRPEVAGGQPGALSPLPTPTTTQTSVPGLSSSQAAFACKKHGHNSNNRTMAAIVGGLLGGIVLIVLIVALMLWRHWQSVGCRKAAAVTSGKRVAPLQEKVSKEDQDEPSTDAASVSSKGKQDDLEPPTDVVPSAV